MVFYEIQDKIDFRSIHCVLQQPLWSACKLLSAIVNFQILIRFCVHQILWFSLYIDGLVQDCSNSIANALELLQACTEPSICIEFLPNSLLLLLFHPVKF